ncbi:MAG TPA: Rpn family recombination-promoting nuclease/putative transposase [Arsenophonus nasoniae]|uniref:Rpn family recombination-promoting nuclease/putative transposase n=1 Tax=Arsenophonus nasoniae TaxID=638 RepID=UPI003879FBD3
MQHKRMALLELIQKHIRRRDMTELLDSIVKLLSYNYYTDNQVITMFNYLIQEGNAKKPMEFITEIAKQSEKHEGALMTIAQQIEEIGINKGIQQGKLEAQLEIARQMLESGMDRQSVMKFTGLTDADMSSLFKD